MLIFKPRYLKKAKLLRKGVVKFLSYKKDLISELETMVPFTEHLHVHDSFGKFKRMYTYIFPEDITYGQGDIHLPLGWGDIPFKKIFSTLKLKKDIFFNFELTHRYKKYYSQNIEIAKKLISFIQ